MKSDVAFVTRMPLSSSHLAMRLASPSLRWPPPLNGITYAFGYGTIQLCCASVKPRSVRSESEQQSGRSASVTPRRKTSTWSRMRPARLSIQ